MQARLHDTVGKIIPLAVADGQAAVTYVRQHASEWGISPDRVGIIGFSAGGRVTAGVALHYSPEGRPAFVAPIYAGTESKDVPVLADAPPMFIAAATDDSLGLAPQSIALYEKWADAKKSVELHMQLVVSSGTLWPAYAGLPISYSDVTRVLLKVNLVRYAVWSPIFIVYAVGLAIVIELPWFFGVRFALALLAVLISAQGIFIMGQHANGTNDTRRLTWHSLVAIVSVLLLVIAYLVSVGVFFGSAGWAGAPDIALAAGGCAASFLFSWLSWAVYRLLYNRGRIDLLRLPN